MSTKSLLKVENQKTDQYAYFQDDAKGLKAATKLMKKWAKELLPMRKEQPKGARFRTWPEVFIHRLGVGKEDDMLDSDQTFAEESLADDSE